MNGRIRDWLWAIYFLYLAVLLALGIREAARLVVTHLFK